MARDITLRIIAFLHLKGHSLLKLRVQELLLEGFLYVEVVKLLLLLVSMRTSKKEILLFLFSS